MSERDLTRADAIVRGALAVAGVYGAGAMTGFLGRALAASGSDLAALAVMLKFEHVEVALFEGAKRRLRPSGELRDLLLLLEQEERDHLETLAGEARKLGGKPPGALEYAFAYRTVYEFLRIALEIEDAIIAAYNGAIPTLGSAELVALTGSVVQVEGRHAAALRLQRGDPPAPKALDPARSEFPALRSLIRFAGSVVYS